MTVKPEAQPKPPTGFTVTQGRRCRTPSKGAMADSARAQRQAAGTLPDIGKVGLDVSREIGSWCRRAEIGTVKVIMSASRPGGRRSICERGRCVASVGTARARRDSVQRATAHSGVPRSSLEAHLPSAQGCCCLAPGISRKLIRPPPGWAGRRAVAKSDPAMPARHLQRVASHGDNLRRVAPGRRRRRSHACPA